jgi:hypothetical protein
MRDIQVLKTYGAAPYAASLKKIEKEIKDKQQSINDKIGVKVFNSIQDLLLDLTVLGIRHWPCTSSSLGYRGR